MKAAEARNAANVKPRGAWFRLNLRPLTRVVLSRKRSSRRRPTIARIPRLTE